MNTRCVGRRISFISVLVAAVLVMFTGTSSFGASGHPKNCWDVKHRNMNAPDGDYLIEPAREKAFTVYCADMNIAPKEYLTLVNTGGDFNFGQYTAGGASPGTDVRTYFTKVRIDPLTFVVDLDDLTFATSTGLLCHSQFSFPCEVGQVASWRFGVASDCRTYSSSTGVANIDLRGTPFAVNDVFSATGFVAAGSVTFNGQTVNLTWDQTVSVLSQVVNITGGGYCGDVGPGSSYYTNLLKLKWIAD